MWLLYGLFSFFEIDMIDMVMIVIKKGVDRN